MIPIVDIDPSTFLQIDRLTKKLGALMTGHLADIGAEAAAKYILMVIKKEIPPYRYVSRKQAYGRTFFSDAQRRWFWAAVKSGEIAFPIHYTRTGELANGWKMVGSGTNLRLENRTTAAFYAYSEAQAKQLALVDWRKISNTMEEKERNASDSANRAIQKEVSRVINAGA